MLIGESLVIWHSAPIPTVLGDHRPKSQVEEHQPESVSYAHRSHRRLTGLLVEAVANNCRFLIELSAARSVPSPAFVHGVALTESQP